MAIINSSSFSILNARTVKNILETRLVQSNTKYPHIKDRFYDIKQTTNNKLIISVKGAYASNEEKIYDNIVELFSTDVLLRGKNVFTTGEKPDVLGMDFLINLQRGPNKVQIYFKTQKTNRESLPEILQAGVLNEEYFASKIIDQIQKINEAKAAVGMQNIFSPKLNVELIEGNFLSNGVRNYLISGVKHAKRVGQQLSKSDVNLTTNTNKVIKISLKKENFAFWSSAKQYKAAKNIMDYLVNQNIISFSNVNGRTQLTEISTGNKINGIRMKANPNEIKKFCFGVGQSKVDYILINTFIPGSFSEIKNIGRGNDYNMKVYCKEVYKESANDIIRMMDNVYLSIFPVYSVKEESKILSADYPGLGIKFMTNSSTSKYYEPSIPSNVSLNRL